MDERGRLCLPEEDLQSRQQEQGIPHHMQKEICNVSRDGSISEALTERIRGIFHVVNAYSHQKNTFLPEL